MSLVLDETHDAALQSWIESANLPDTDFYTSIHDATTVCQQFRPDNPLLPNYKWVPMGDHARASSIVLSRWPIWTPPRIAPKGLSPLSWTCGCKPRPCVRQGMRGAACRLSTAVQPP